MDGSADIRESVAFRMIGSGGLVIVGSLVLALAAHLIYAVVEVPATLKRPMTGIGKKDPVRCRTLGGMVATDLSHSLCSSGTRRMKSWCWCRATLRAVR